MASENPVSGDTWLRTRDDDVVVQPHPEPQIYTAYVTTLAPIVQIEAPLYDVAEDGTVTLVDTRPAPLTVETDDDGAVVVRIPV